MVDTRFPKKLGVVCHGCVSHRHGLPPSLLTSILLSKYGAAHPSWFLFNCALPKLYKFTRFLDLRAFAGFSGRFADFLRFAGNFWAQLCAFICIGARDMRMAWHVLGTQPGCKPCSVTFKMSIVVIVWPLGSKTRQTSRIRLDEILKTGSF